MSGQYTLESTRLFDVRVVQATDVAGLARLFPQVRLSILSAGASWDTRVASSGVSRE